MSPEDLPAADNRPDQMGVELGKVLAKAILAQLDKPEDVTGHDSSVRTLALRFCLFSILKVLATDNRSHSLLPEIQEGVNTSVGLCATKHVNCNITRVPQSTDTEKFTLAWEELSQLFRSKCCSNREREIIQRCTKFWLCA